MGDPRFQCWINVAGDQEAFAKVILDGEEVEKRLPTLSQLQEAAAERGDPEMACYSCSHYRIRTDGPSHMGRCNLVDEPQFEFGVCFEYEWDGSRI